MLSSISSPNDIKSLNDGQLNNLAAEIRQLIVKVVGKNGGHLASNLGVVELTVALHKVFDSPKDKIIFDVSHQCYTHKLLTGRNDRRFLKLRHNGGYSGFLDPDASPHDQFVAGHAGTALSIALGFAYARDRLNENSNIVAVLGDASFSCGLTLEALNNIATTTRRLIIVLNDNEFSIDRNVGAIAAYFNELIRSKIYERITDFLKKIIGRGKFGIAILNKVRQFKRLIKGIFLPSSYFEYYGLRYIGPFNGHDIHRLVEVFESCKNLSRPVIVHVKTTKGKGFEKSEKFPEKFHGLDPSSSETSRICGSTYGEILGHELVRLGKLDKRIVGITAAMARGTGLSYLREQLPGQFIDVGIAESHAMTLAGALAKSGMRPICAIYSTFAQRSFDQILHDICIQNLPVVLCLDRVGVAAHDGVTHHGLFDLSFLRIIPNIVIVQPHGAQDFINIINSALGWNCPVAIRYAKNCPNSNCAPKVINVGQWEVLLEGNDVCLLAAGGMLTAARESRIVLEEKGYSVGIVNARFVKPIDCDLLKKIHKQYRLIVTLEDNVLAGGFGSAVLEFFNEIGERPNVMRIGWPDKFIKFGDSASLKQGAGVVADDIVRKISGFFA